MAAILHEPTTDKEPQPNSKADRLLEALLYVSKLTPSSERIWVERYKKHMDAREIAKAAIEASK